MSSISIIFIIVLCSHFLYVNWKLKKDLHILQLNSYRNARYTNWLIKKKSIAFRLKDLLPFLAIFPLFFLFPFTHVSLFDFHLFSLVFITTFTAFAPFLALILFIIIYSALWLRRSREREIKPLVFTVRVIRLYSFEILVLCISYVILLSDIWYSGSSAWQSGNGVDTLTVLKSILILAMISFASPILLLISNFLLLPLEKIINQYYFNDAKKRLQAVPNLIVIGITGSFGKTSAKYVLNEILRHKYHTLMTPGSFNTPMGIAKVVRADLKPTHEIFIAEVSAKQIGDVKELCDLLHPRFGLITAIGEQHLETFKSIENIKKTKNELIEALPEDGIAFFNADNECCLELARSAQMTKKKCVLYGIDDDATIANLDLDYVATDITIDDKGSVFTVFKRNKKRNESGVNMQDEVQQETATFSTKLLGRHNIYNILAAIAIASEFGIKLEAMVYPIRQLNAVPHRLELKKINQDVTLIDDSFNANPVGSKMALEVLQNMLGKRKIIVTPGMIELGAEEYNCNRKFGEYIAAVCDYVILVGGKQTQPIQDGLNNKKFSLEKIFIARDFSAANHHLQSILQSHDVVLFENDLPDNYKE